MSLASVAVNLTASGIVIAVWEIVKAGYRAFQSRRYTWMTFESTEEARLVAEDVSKYHFDRDLDANVDMDVWWSPGPYGLESSPPRFMVSVPNVLIDQHSAGMAKESYRESIKERAK